MNYKDIINQIKNKELSVDEGFKRIKARQDANRRRAIENSTPTADRVQTTPFDTKKSILNFVQYDWQAYSFFNTETKVNINGAVLVFAANREDARALLVPEVISLFNNRPVYIILPGNGFKALEKNIYTINAEDSESYVKLLKILQKRNHSPGLILFLWSLTPWENKDVVDIGELQIWIHAVFNLTQALMHRKINAIRMFYFHLGLKEVLNPIHTAMEGFAKTLALESPQMTCQVVSVAAGGDSPNKNKAIEDIKLALPQLLDIPSNEFAIHLEDRSWFARRFRAVLSSEATAIEMPLFKSAGVYLITGGMGGVGWLLAKYLSKSYQAKLILCGRSALTPEQFERLEMLNQSKVQAFYLPVDITRQDDVQQLCQTARQKFARIDGVLHCAGVLSDSLLYKKTQAELDQVLAPKLSGTLNLDLATAEDKLDFFMMFSSIAALWGNVGQADYAFGNRFMDQLASVRQDKVRRKERHGLSISINWPFWKQGGMPVDEKALQYAREAYGMHPLNDLDGWDTMDMAWACRLSQLAVLKGTPDKINTLLSIDTNPRRQEQAAADGMTWDSHQFLKAELENYLVQMVAYATKVPPERIQREVDFEKYGVDSVMILNFITDLEQHLGSLSKNLFFEYQNIASLADHLNETFQNPLQAWFQEKEKQTSAKGLTTEKKAMQPISAETRIPDRFVKRPWAESLIASSPSIQSREPRKNMTEEAIAIIGLSGRYPMADNIDQFWENLKTGLDCIVEIPESLWDYRPYYSSDRNQSGQLYSKWGGFIQDADKFDPHFFNILPNEAEFIDPQERIFLEAVWHALEDSGYTIERLKPYRVGVFAGVMYGLYQLLQTEVGGNIMGPSSSYASIANRVSYICDFKGPSFAVDSMCSSSLTALHLACRSILRGESDLAVAGGVNLSLHPNKYLLLSLRQFLSTDGKCRSFGAGGDGYVPGEGVGVVLLKPLSAAISDNDQIYGIIRGSSVNHGGHTSGYSVPNPYAQSRLISDAIRQAGIHPRQITYIEAHGTGTALGDPIEIEGLTKAFENFTHDRQFCAIGSVKSNIGHLESAAGIAGLTKVLLQMKHHKLVPSLHAAPLNPHIDFNKSPFWVQRQLDPWPKPILLQQGHETEGTRIAGISSFGAGGANAYLIVEEYEAQKHSHKPDKGGIFLGVKPLLPPPEENRHIIVLSAKNNERLKEVAQRMVRFLNRLKSSEKNSENKVDLLSIAYTLQRGRIAMECRLALIAGSMDDLYQSLDQFLRDQNPGDTHYLGNTGDPEHQRVKKDQVAGKAELEKLIHGRDLNKIAQMWVNGEAVDWPLIWTTLYRVEQFPEMISLPGYPFARERYWINEISSELMYDRQPVFSDDAQKRESDYRVDPGQEAISNYLIDLICRVTKLHADKLTPHISFERLGFDSVTIMNITRELEKNVGDISKTLFFEYPNIAELSAYFNQYAKYKFQAIAEFPSVTEQKNNRYYEEKEKRIPEKQAQETDLYDTPSFEINTTKQIAEDPTDPLLPDDIAIIGLAGRYPQANNIDELWDNLKKGKDCIIEIPEGRWDFRKEQRQSEEGTYKWGGFLDQVDHFDPLFFNISPKEAIWMDPQARLFLETTWHTLEDAGYTRSALKDATVGVFVGLMWGEYQLFKDQDDNVPLSPGSSYASIPNRVSYFFDFTGPSLALDTMCSSSMTAIHLACESIRRKECDYAIAGGVNVSIHPNKYGLLSMQHFLSSDGRCRSFGEGGDGYVPGEGVGAVMIKPLEQAIADHDQIYAVIKGCAINHGGRSNGYAVPNPKAQAHLIETVFRQNKIHPRYLSYMEAHGTGTALGDPIEIEGLRQAFQHFTNDRQYCPIGSVKSNIGHLESAAGIAGLSKILLQLKYRQLVPSLHSKHPNTNIKFENSPFYIQKDLGTWKRPKIVEDGQVKTYPRMAGISSFGAGGANSHMVVAEYNRQQVDHSVPPDGPYLIVLSAQNKAVLKRYCENMYDWTQRRLTEKQLPQAEIKIPLSSVIDKVRSMIADILDIHDDEIDISADMADLGMETVKLNQFTGRLSDGFAIDIELEQFLQTSSIQSFSQYLLRNYPEKLKDLFSYNDFSIFKNDIADDKQLLRNMAYTLQVGREAMKERLAFIAADFRSLNEKLNAYLKGSPDVEGIHSGSTETHNPTTDLLLTGKAGRNFIQTIIEEKSWGQIAQLWVMGVGIDWALLYSDSPPMRVSLPVYPFDRKPYWLGQEKALGQDRPEDQIKRLSVQSIEIPKNDQETHWISKDWQLSPSIASVPEKQVAANLVILTDEPFKDDVASIFASSPQLNKIIIRHRTTYSADYPLGEFGFDFDQADQGAKLAKALFERLEPDLKGLSDPLIGILDISDLKTQTPSEFTPAWGKIALLQGFLKILPKFKSSGNAFLFHFTNGLTPYKSDHLSMAGAGIAGLIKMLSAEYPDLISKTIDVNMEINPHTRLEPLETIVLKELADFQGSREVCYRSGHRYIPQLNAASQLKDSQKGIQLDAQKAYLITGGLGGIGAEMVRYLVARGVRKLMILGITALPPQHKWPELLANNSLSQSLWPKIETLQQMIQQGIQVSTYTGSLKDHRKLERFIQKSRENLGPVGGVLHCAGVSIHNNPAFFRKEIKDIKRVLEPKVDGLIHLHKILSSEELDFFIVFSSVASQIPVLAKGMLDYSAANAFMDYFVDYQYHSGRRYYKSINWPMWQEVGMAKNKPLDPAYKALGFAALSNQQGLDLFEQILKGTDHPVLMPCITEAHFKLDPLLKHATPSPIKKREPSNTKVVRIPLNHKQRQNTLQMDSKEKRSSILFLKEWFTNTLYIPEDRLDENTPFGDLGVDSVMVAELVKEIERHISQKFDPTIILEHPTVEKLAALLDQQFDFDHPSHEKSALEKPGADNNDDAADANLSENRHDPRNAAFTSPSSGLKASDNPIPYHLPGSPKIAVIGMACHFPGASNVEAFWNNLAQGQGSIREIPENRWDIDTFYRPEPQKGKSISKWGGFINDIEMFDPAFFKIPEKDASHLDPLVRQFLEISVQTIANAGYTKAELWKKNVGVFVGSRVGAFAEKIDETLKNSIVGTGQNFIAAHISHYFNFKGPSLVVDTACSSSLYSIHLACQSLIANETQYAIAGGVDILLDEKPYIVLSESMALSPDGLCRTFDERANGFVLGEGCGAVLLKPLDRAVKEGDQIYAVIEATAVNNDGHTMGFTTPNPEAQREVIQQAIQKAGIQPRDIEYVETHGTGTMIGDPIELKALASVFQKETSQTNFCGVGSVKANVGHLLSAAGIASFIKTVLSINHKSIPPAVNCERPNPRFNFETSPFYINRKLKKWIPKSGVRRSGISSFGFGGTNVHIILGEKEANSLSEYRLLRKPLPPVEFNRSRYWPQDPPGKIGSIYNDQRNSAGYDEERYGTAVKEVPLQLEEKTSFVKQQAATSLMLEITDESSFLKTEEI